MSKRVYQTLYEILGIPYGIGVDHVKDSYRLLTKKTPVTEGAYGVLSDPIKKQQYDAELWAAVRIEAITEPQWHVKGDPPLDSLIPSVPATTEGIHWYDPGTELEADEWLRANKQEFINLQNPIIGYQCGLSSESEACCGGFTLFFVSSLNHVFLLRHENDDMLWSMLDKNYLTQAELRLSLLRWWTELEDRHSVELGEVEMVDERLITVSEFSSYPETRVIYLP